MENRHNNTTDPSYRIHVLTGPSLAWDGTARGETPSALRLINMANERLGPLLFGIGAEERLEQKIFEVVKLLRLAMNLNQDVALACILLNQNAACYATRHCIDTALVAMSLARATHKAPHEIQIIMAAALTMNIGMVTAHDSLQAKADGLSAADRDLIHGHAAESVRILREANISQREWLQYVAAHHDIENGCDDPCRERVADMPENAQILAVADRYCARVSSRRYRMPLLPNAALRDMLASDRATLTPALATTFINEIGIYPAGTFVRLENGETGIVTGKGSSTTAPVVQVLSGPGGAPLALPAQRDTGDKRCQIRDVLHPEQAAARPSMQEVWGLEAAL